MIKGLHHNAYRCRDSEETRRFYEDFLGLPLAAAIELEASKTGRATRALHTLYTLEDGSFLGFFEVPDQPFEFREQHDFDLHIALEVDPGGVDVPEEARDELGDLRFHLALTLPDIPLALRNATGAILCVLGNLVGFLFR